MFTSLIFCLLYFLIHFIHLSWLQIFESLAILFYMTELQSKIEGQKCWWILFWIYFWVVFFFDDTEVSIDNADGVVNYKFPVTRCELRLVFIYFYHSKIVFSVTTMPLKVWNSPSNSTMPVLQHISRPIVSRNGPTLVIQNHWSSFLHLNTKNYVFFKK